MAYKDFSKILIEYLNNITSYLKGDKSTSTMSDNIQPNLELSAIQNSSSARQIITLSNAYYDQVAFKRTLKEIYKTPKEYYQDYIKMLEVELKSLNLQADDVSEQHISVINNSKISKNLLNISPELQSKLSDFK